MSTTKSSAYDKGVPKCLRQKSDELERLAQKIFLAFPVLALLARSNVYVIPALPQLLAGLLPFAIHATPLNKIATKAKHKYLQLRRANHGTKERAKAFITRVSLKRSVDNVA